MAKGYASTWMATGAVYMRTVPYYAGWTSVMIVTIEIYAVKMNFTK